MKRQQVALVAFLVTPLIVIVVLVYLIAGSLGRGVVKQPPVGAGGGDTGGANAIGERIAETGGGDPGATLVPTSSDGPAGAAPAPLEETDAAMVQPESLAQGFVLVVEDATGLAGPASPIYLAGNVNGWNPADAAWKLAPQSDMKWRLVVPKPTVEGRMAFKFTRGAWDLEELDDSLAAIENRTLLPIDASKLAPGEQPKIELTIRKFGDQRPETLAKRAIDPYRPLNVQGTVRRLQVRGGAATAAGTVRDLLVWLPPGYDAPENAVVTYPVLYLHDGQNLFEKPPAAPGEWGVDETAMALVTRGAMRPAIIVGIPHSGEGRLSEYLPVEAVEGVKPEGARHVAWLLEEVMPRVERAFRVKTGPESTGIGGSSLGAVISLYAATKHPDRFGLLLAESLPLRTGRVEAWDGFLNGVTAWPRRVYLGMGGSETGADASQTERNKGYVDAVRALDARLQSAGLGADRRLLVIEPGATHTETAWAKRLPAALTFLFPPAVDTTK